MEAALCFYPTSSALHGEAGRHLAVWQQCLFDRVVFGPSAKHCEDKKPRGFIRISSSNVKATCRIKMPCLAFLCIFHCSLITGSLLYISERGFRSFKRKDVALLCSPTLHPVTLPTWATSIFSCLTRPGGRDALLQGSRRMAGPLLAAWHQGEFWRLHQHVG